VLAKARAALVFVDEVMKARAVPDDFRAAVEQFEELSG
jgi:acyl-CoA thioesterase FadM